MRRRGLDWARRHPRLTAGLGAVLLLALVGACGGQRPAAPPPPAPHTAPAPAAAETAPSTVPPASTVRAVPTAPVPTVPAPKLATGGKCSDYASQAEAQAALRRDPVRAGRLDDDRDGIACEGSPSPRDTAPVARPPTGR